MIALFGMEPIVYLLFKFLHLSGAIVSLGSMFGVLVLGWVARKGAVDVGIFRVQFERLISACGMVLVVAGVALTHLRGWDELFTSYWLPSSLGLIAIGLVIERKFERTLPLHLFAVARLLPYIAALALMVFKPT